MWAENRFTMGAFQFLQRTYFCNMDNCFCMTIPFQGAILEFYISYMFLKMFPMLEREQVEDSIQKVSAFTMQLRLQNNPLPTHSVLEITRLLEPREPLIFSGRANKCYLAGMEKDVWSNVLSPMWYVHDTWIFLKLWQNPGLTFVTQLLACGI